MSKRTHTTVSGQHLEYDETPNVVAFLERVEKAIADPKTSARELSSLAFSNENPFLTLEGVLLEPAYHVMVDLLFRKLLADETDIEKLAERYSMTIEEAATKLGFRVNAARQAIAAKRLAVWVKNGQRFIDPRTLDAIEEDRERAATSDRIRADRS